MAELKENVIEWITGEDTISVTLSQTKHINKVERLAKKYPDLVQILKRNSDGSIFAHLPLKFIKISAPRQITEEQREQARERFKNMHKTKAWTETDSLDLY
jgi:hypothetical protein